MYQKSIVSGNAGKDVEVRTAGNCPVASFSIASTEKVQKGGELVDKVTWHNVVCFGKTAEKAQELVQKGKLIHVKGTISHSKYEKDGVTHSKTEIVAEDLSLTSFQTTIIVGNAGKDVELRYTAGGTAVSSFAVATSEKIKGKTGEWEDKTTWHNIVCWGRTAEIAAEFVCKGKLVLIEGTISYSKFEKDGINHTKTEITADVLRLLGGGPKRG